MGFRTERFVNMAYLTALFLCLYLISGTTSVPAKRNSGKEGFQVKCNIDMFLRNLSETVLVSNNRFACDEKAKETLIPGQYCFHIYKCPLDFKKLDRKTPALCGSDGEWDYIMPTCKDVIPMAYQVDLELAMHPDENSKYRRRRKTRRVLATQEKNSDVQEVYYRIKRTPLERKLSEGEKGTNFALLRFGFKMVRSTSTLPPPPSFEMPKPNTPEFFQWVDSQCRKVQAHICKIANSEKKCASMEGIADMKYYHGLCKACVARNICKKSITLLGRSV